MKKPFWKTTFGIILKSVLKLGAGMIIKNQKKIKGTNNEKIIDDIIESVE